MIARYPIGGAVRSRAAWVAIAVCLLLDMPVAAQEPAAGAIRMFAAEGRQMIALAPGAYASEAPPASYGGLAVQSFETASRRIYVVSMSGETYRAAAPLDGPRSRIAFDPARRTFASLLPSIRVELSPGVDIDAVLQALGADESTVFESLGFAIVGLPAELHPAEAVARLQVLPGQPAAAVRLRGPRIEWR